MIEPQGLIFDCDGVLFDSNKIWTFEKNNVFSRSINSPFYGRSLSGKVKYTISKGYISQI